MYKARYIKHTLLFNFPGGTSRGILYEKPSWYVLIEDENGNSGIGEISIIPGLSIDDESVMEIVLNELCANINTVIKDYSQRYEHSPAIRFGIETAIKAMKNNSPFKLYKSSFTEGKDFIKINGLIWMSDSANMNRQIESKLANGFTCLKMKIGAINFEDELQILKSIRKRFSKDVLELRVDANGAFSPDEALSKLEELSSLHLHSIEQPIKAEQWDKMSMLCSNTPLPIALDEELIGVKNKKELLESIKPQYIILKPSLLGGFKASEEWIKLAGDKNIGWWITSALEGNIGLNAIAQWTYTLKNYMPQGLGTGQVFKNNVSSPLYLNKDHLFYNPEISWADPFKRL